MDASILAGRRQRELAPARAQLWAWRDAGRAFSLWVTAAVVAVGAVSLWWLPDAPAALATGLALLALVAAAVVDVRERRLPNRLVALAAVPVAVATIVEPGGLGAALLGAAFIGAPLLATHLVSPAGMGFGDVKAGTALGAAVGLVAPQLALVGFVLALGGGSLWGLARRERSIPLGPALVAGAVGALAIGQLLGVDAVAS